MRRIPVLIGVLGLLLCLGAASAVAASSTVTDKDIPRVDAAGLFKRITAEKGKVVVVNIFASWCPPCRDEIPGIINIRRSYPQDKVVIIGVSVEQEIQSLINYMNNMRMNYPVLFAKGDFVQRFKVRSVPHLLIYDKKGELAFNIQRAMSEADLKREIDKALAK